MSITLPRAESLCDLVEPGSVPEAEKPIHGLALPSQLALQIGARLPHRGQSDVKCDLEKDLGRELKDQSILRNSGCDRDVVAIVIILWRITTAASPAFLSASACVSPKDTNGRSELVTSTVPLSSGSKIRR